MSLNHSSSAAFFLLTPRGQMRSTRMRAPSALAGFSYTRLILNFDIDGSLTKHARSFNSTFGGEDFGRQQKTRSVRGLFVALIMKFYRRIGERMMKTESTKA